MFLERILLYPDTDHPPDKFYELSAFTVSDTLLNMGGFAELTLRHGDVPVSNTEFADGIP